MNDFVRKISVYSIKAHADTNQMYDKFPYSKHLEMVYEFGTKFIHLIPENKKEIVLSACWTHDLIEDARKTYNDIKDFCGFEIAEITFALTNDKGKTRKERAGEKYYQGIRNIPFATFVKLCDRLANITYSKETQSRFIKSYRKENAYFQSQLFEEKYEEMFFEIENLLK